MTHERAAAPAICREAEALIQQGNREANERALALYSQAIEADPAYAPAYAGLAIASCQAMVRYGRPRDQVDTCLALAEKSIALDPRLAVGHEALAFVHFARGALPRSLEAHYRVHDLDPAYPDAVANIAFLHLDLGELDRAVRWNQRALAAEPQSAYVHRNFGRLCLMFGDDTGAEAWLKKSIELQPKFSSARVLLVYLYFGRGNVPRALEQARIMVEMKPDDPETVNFAADVALLQGDLHEAGRLFRRALELGPDSRNFYRSRRAKTGLGYVLWMEDDRAAARRLFDERIAVRMAEFDGDLNAWGPPYELAAIHAVQDSRGEALQWLRRAIERGWREPHLVRSDILLERLRDDLQFEEILSDLRNRIREMRGRAGDFPAVP